MRSSAVNQIPANSVLLFEDIDCMKSGQARVLISGEETPSDRKEKENPANHNAVTLSGLLNVLDGFFAPTGVLFMMTTNRIEALDPALLRPGRIDYRLYLGFATECQKVELYRRFFPLAAESEAYAFVGAHSGAKTMAEFQGLLLAMAENHPSVRIADMAASPDWKEKEELVPELR